MLSLINRYDFDNLNIGKTVFSDIYRYMDIGIQLILYVLEFIALPLLAIIQVIVVIYILIYVNIYARKSKVIKSFFFLATSIVFMFFNNYIIKNTVLSIYIKEIYKSTVTLIDISQFGCDITLVSLNKPISLLVNCSILYWIIIASILTIFILILIFRHFESIKTRIIYTSVLLWVTIFLIWVLNMINSTWLGEDILSLKYTDYNPIAWMCLTVMTHSVIYLGFIYIKKVYLSKKLWYTKYKYLNKVIRPISLKNLVFYFLFYTIIFISVQYLGLCSLYLFLVKELLTEYILKSSSDLWSGINDLFRDPERYKLPAPPPGPKDKLFMTGILTTQKLEETVDVITETPDYTNDLYNANVVSQITYMDTITNDSYRVITYCLGVNGDDIIIYKRYTFKTLASGLIHISSETFPYNKFITFTTDVEEVQRKNTLVQNKCFDNVTYQNLSLLEKKIYMDHIVNLLDKQKSLKVNRGSPTIFKYSSINLTNFFYVELSKKPIGRQLGFSVADLEYIMSLPGISNEEFYMKKRFHENKFQGLSMTIDNLKRVVNES